MEERAQLVGRRTSTDVVYEYLHQEIVTLNLRPGAKISETEIAGRFGISRQPVRDAFARLANEDLLLVQPQKATEVRRFSERKISKARFVRMAVEVEVLRNAALAWDGNADQAIRENLTLQERAAADGNAAEFHAHDKTFHDMLCEAANAPLAGEAINENRAPVDRLCVLSLVNREELANLLQDHRDIFGRLQANDPDGVETSIRNHLGRLDKTIANIRAVHEGYFDT
ncbi:GntR family transcriptional regulator [Yoonia sp. 2307UL14-13]|uniref:GntR family transcriptional regulator n=1 Tax=Yoonia sp. 2307UL14-13 TaxID=3126506 RepID=UPI00309EEF8A